MSSFSYGLADWLFKDFIGVSERAVGKFGFEVFRLGMHHGLSRHMGILRYKWDRSVKYRYRPGNRDYERRE